MLSYSMFLTAWVLPDLFVTIPGISLLINIILNYPRKRSQRTHICCIINKLRRKITVLYRIIQCYHELHTVIWGLAPEVAYSEKKKKNTHSKWMGNTQGMKIDRYLPSSERFESNIHVRDVLRIALRNDSNVLQNRVSEMQSVTKNFVWKSCVSLKTIQ